MGFDICEVEDICDLFTEYEIYHRHYFTYKIVNQSYAKWAVIEFLNFLHRMCESDSKVYGLLYLTSVFMGKMEEYYGRNHDYCFKIAYRAINLLSKEYLEPAVMRHTEAE